MNWNSVLTLWNKLLYWSLPIRGAWIEIECMDFSYGFFHRPHAGSVNWNTFSPDKHNQLQNRAQRGERELKSSADFKTNNASLSRSIWGAWIEIVRNNENSAESYITPHGRSESWNNFADNENLLRKQIAPHTGTRIEISISYVIMPLRWDCSHHTRSENWNTIFYPLPKLLPNRSPYGERELKFCWGLSIRKIIMPLPRRGVNWNGDTITEQSYSLSKRERELKHNTIMQNNLLIFSKEEEQ